MFLSKGAGAGPIATQLGPVCARTYATPARGQVLLASRIVADKLQQARLLQKLWQARLLQTSYGRQIIMTKKTEYSIYSHRLLGVSY